MDMLEAGFCDLTDLTWDGYLTLPYETRNAGLVDGRVVANYPPSAQHELVLRNITVALVSWTRSGPNRGAVSTQQPIRIDDRCGYQFDAAWYPSERCAPHDHDQWFTGDPSLVIEVISPAMHGLDVLRRHDAYQGVGIAELWLISDDPHDRSVLVCRRPDRSAPYVHVELKPEDRLSSPLLEGFDLSVVDVFRR